MLIPNDIPMIRDMTAQCKGCLCYCFPDDINKNGLCSRCEKDGVPPREPIVEVVEDDWNDW